MTGDPDAEATPAERGPGPLALLRTGGERRARVLAGYVIALAGDALAIAVFLPARDRITPLSKGFGFLVVVVAAAAVGGLWPGVVASIAGFVVFNYLFIPPYGTFRIGRLEDVVVLFVFLGLSVVISILLARATERAQVAESRRLELEALQLLSSDLVSMPPGPDSYSGVLRRLLWLFECSSASLRLERATDFRGLDEGVAVGEPSSATADGAPFEERIPLVIQERTLGLLTLLGDRPPLVPAESRVLRAFAAHLTIMLERDRMLAASVRAQTTREALAPQ
jgi:two-component system, OmpR family, sensor histidine kinase KdpD